MRRSATADQAKPRVIPRARGFVLSEVAMAMRLRDDELHEALTFAAMSERRDWGFIDRLLDLMLERSQ